MDVKVEPAVSQYPLNIVHPTSRQTRNCEICGNEFDFEILGRRNYQVFRRHRIFSMEFDDSLCRKCGFVFQRDVPDDEFIAAYYSEGFTTKTAQARSLGGYDTEARLDVIRRHIPQGAKIIEIGASDGEFCRSLLAIGYNASGLDPLASESNATGNDIVREELIGRHDTRDESSELFDTAVSYYVLEHVLDTRKWLRDIAASLKDGGHLIIEIPNYESFPAESLIHEHMSHFAPAHLAALVESLGFKTVSTTESPSRFFGMVIVAQFIGASKPAPDFNFAKQVVSARASYAAGIAEHDRRQAKLDHVAHAIKKSVDARGGTADIYLWGINEYASALSQKIQAITGLVSNPVDNALSKIGAIQEGFQRPVTGPKFPVKWDKHRIFVLCSPRWNTAIRAQVEAMGLENISIVDGAEDLLR
jgi:2-polyprenyl-3-methyl-5-hydroxy-6-metoxy-1,4-benzoquinol methylase